MLQTTIRRYTTQADKLKGVRDMNSFLGESARPKLTPTKPKRAANPFFMFSKEQRLLLGPENKKNSIIMQQEFAEKWKQMTKEEKLPYFEEYAAVKAAKSAHIDKNKPKLQNAYTIFFKEARPKIAAENPTLKSKEIVGLVGKAWRELSEDQKKPYQMAAWQALKQYLEYKNKDSQS